MRNKPLKGIYKKPLQSIDDARDATRSISRRLDQAQTALDVGGMTPGAGIIPDLANVAISGGRSIYNLLKGDTGAAKKHVSQAGMSLGASIPFLGQLFGGAKIAKKGSNLLKNWKNVGKNKTDLSKTMIFEKPPVSSTKFGGYARKEDLLRANAQKAKRYGGSDFNK